MNFFFIIFLGAIGGFFVITTTLMMPLVGEIKGRKYEPSELGEALGDYIRLLSNTHREDGYRRDLRRIMWWYILDFFVIIYSIIVMSN